MTEEEAKTKWCPFARVVPGRLLVDSATMQPVGNIPAHNRVQERGEPEATWHLAMHCIGSACMAWRWFSLQGGETVIEAIKRHRTETGSTLMGAKTYVESHPEYMRVAPPERGFCGLAGKP